MKQLSVQLKEYVMKTVISKSAAVLFALTLGCGMAYGAMGGEYGNGDRMEKRNDSRCGSSKKNKWAGHCGSAPKCGEAKALFKKQHCASGKATEGKPKSDARCGVGKCG
jgi:hypothetical protein